MDQNSLFDGLLPVFQFEERHGRRVAAPPGRVLDAVATLSLRDDPLIRALLGLREVPAWLGKSQRAVAPSFSMADFVPLGRRDNAEIAWGLVGKFWRPSAGVLPLPDAAAFRGSCPPGHAKLVWSFEAWATEQGERDS